MGDTGDITPLTWLIWWAEGCLLQADLSWQTGRITLPDSPRLRDWLHVNAVQVNRHFALPPAAPPPDPLASLMHIGTLDAAQREKILRLMARVCQPERESDNDDEEAKWCERLAKALRPGLWLPAQARFSSSARTGRYHDALMLLRARYGETCWPRLRLLFPREWAANCLPPATPLPAARLNALCDALIWKASVSA